MFLPRSSSRLAMYACIETLSRTSCPTPIERKAKRSKFRVPGLNALEGEAKTERVENIKETALKNEQDCLGGLAPPAGRHRSPEVRPAGLGSHFLDTCSRRMASSL